MYFWRIAARELLERASGGPQLLPATNMAANRVSLTIELFTRFRPPMGTLSCSQEVADQSDEQETQGTALKRLSSRGCIWESAIIHKMLSEMQSIPRQQE